MEGCDGGRGALRVPEGLDSVGRRCYTPSVRRLEHRESRPVAPIRNMK